MCRLLPVMEEGTRIAFFVFPRKTNGFRLGGLGIMWFMYTPKVGLSPKFPPITASEAHQRRQQIGREMQ